MKKITFLSPAEQEMAEAAVYYEEQATGLGSDFLDEVAKAAEYIARYPEASPVIRDDIRRLQIRRFPYGSCIG